jgi:hypothetical protein
MTFVEAIMVRLVTAAMVSIGLFAGSMLQLAKAADMPAKVEEEVKCGQNIPISKRLLTLATGLSAEISGANGARNNPYLISQMHNMSDANFMLGGATVVFVKTNVWRAYMVAEAEFVQGIRVSGDDRRVVLLTMHTVEGPGATYTVMTTPDSFETMTCAVLEFPKELNKPDYRLEYLEFADFNTTESGQGTLLGSATISDKDYWFTYQTPDFGMHWSEPSRFETKPANPVGTLVPAAKVDLTLLIKDLLSAAN